MGIDRRTFLMGAAGYLAAPNLDSREPVVATSAGRVQGRREGPLTVFRGIPFAAPPVGKLRFRPPEPPAPWHGVRQAFEFADVALQGDQGSEDCLYLNVWTPAQPGPHPVLMWIHGGGNVGGGTKWQDASGLAAEGIVVVTVAYRLGAMGFLELAELFNAHFKSSGNNGIRDLVQALHWIRESIAAFGGDPSRVTIAGQSAGAKNVAALLAAPSAQGLFHGAISLSGSGMTVHSRKEAHRVARLLAQELGDPLDLLRRSGREIMTAQGRLGAKYDQAYPFRPVYETLFLPDLPVNLVRGRVPLLLGTCRDESVGFLSGGDEDRPIRSREIANVPFERIPPMETRYSQAFPDLPALDRRVRLVSAEEYWIPSVRLAEAHSARGGQTWMYRFDHLGRTVQTPRDAFVGHGADMDAFWNRRAGFSLHETVVQFIHGRAPDWPTYSTFARNVMLFGEGGRMEVAVDPRGEERVLWNEAIP